MLGLTSASSCRLGLGMRYVDASFKFKQFLTPHIEIMRITTQLSLYITLDLTCSLYANSFGMNCLTHSSSVRAPYPNLSCNRELPTRLANHSLMLQNIVDKSSRCFVLSSLGSDFYGKFITRCCRPLAAFEIAKCEMKMVDE